MARPQKACQGSPIANAPSGFPVYFTRRQQRIVTADVWAFFRHAAESVVVPIQLSVLFTSDDTRLAGHFEDRGDRGFDLASG
jgi:hypothetical protein